MTDNLTLQVVGKTNIVYGTCSSLDEFNELSSKINAQGYLRNKNEDI